jgi:hypothetical protein
MKMKTILLCVLCLSGCSAALVPYTSDPNKKLANATALQQAGRPLPALRLANEALSDFEKDNDVFGMAEVHHFLGGFYRSSPYREFYKNEPNYDPGFTLSIRNYELAVSEFRQEKDLGGVTKSLFEMGQSYYLAGDKEKSCRVHQESLETFKSATVVKDSKGRVHIHTWNSKFKNMGEMITSFMTAHECLS